MVNSIAYVHDALTGLSLGGACGPSRCSQTAGWTVDGVQERGSGPGSAIYTDGCLISESAEQNQ